MLAHPHTLCKVNLCKLLNNMNEITYKSFPPLNILNKIIKCFKHKEDHVKQSFTSHNNS
jgi:hypothetical protein